MYGFIYNTLRSLVVDNYGEETWNNICSKAGITTADYLDHHYYDEAILSAVGEAASELLGVPLEDILEKFGAHFFETIKKSGHSSLLRTLGHNLYGFLVNLDSLHDHLSFTYTQMQAPSFRCEKTPTGLRLHYYSSRKGLEAIAIGIVKAVARSFFDLEVDIKKLKCEELNERLSYHCVFDIETKEICRNEKGLERLGVKQDDLEGEMERVGSETDLPYLLAAQFPGLRSSSTGQIVIDGVNLDFPATVREEPEVPPIAEVPPLPIVVNVPQPESDAVEQLRTILNSRLRPPLRLPPSLLPTLPGMSRGSSRRGSCLFGAHPSDWPVTAHIFQSCFPFHIIFDKDLTVTHMGISLMRLFPRAIATEARISDYFELARPPVDLTYANIRSYLHNVFILNMKESYSKGGKGKKLHFRGQMVPLSVHDPNSSILFLSSPRINSVEELEVQGLYISDIPIHDVTRDLILLNRHFRVEMNIAEQLEKTKHDLEIQKAIVQEEKARADRVLHSMLPPSIARQLKEGEKANATEYSSVTILFSDIKGFTTICSECAPMCVVGMLNNLYTRFDSLIEKHNVYKVETIGDAYMVAAGLLDTSVNHAEAVANMAFDMRDAAKYVVKPATEETLQIRIGIHSGPVVAGVVGLKMPRYCLFGDTVNTASRMESHGEADRVHISDITYQMLRKKPFVFFSRGKIEVKGLGLRETYFIEPANGFDGIKTIMVESADGTLLPSLPVDHSMDFIRTCSFVRYNQIVQMKPSASIVSHKAVYSGNIPSDGHVSPPDGHVSPLGSQSATLLRNAPVSSQVTTEEDNVIIRVPTTDELKRREEQWVNKGAPLSTSEAAGDILSDVNPEQIPPNKMGEMESNSEVKVKRRRSKKCLIT